MFPLNNNDEYIDSTGKRSKLGDAIGSGGSVIPEFSESDAGKVLTVGEDGELEWDEKGSGGGSPYIGLDAPSADLGSDGDFYMQYKNVYAKTAIIPVQADNTNCFASNEGLGAAYKLFDGNDATEWSTAENVNTNQYCGVDLGAGGAAVANVVGIVPRAWQNVVQMEDFKIQGSNDNESWTDIYTGSMPNDASLAGHEQLFEMTNTQSYRYYRLYVIDAYTSKTITVYEMQLYTISDTVIDITEYKTYKKVSGSWAEIV